MKHPLSAGSVLLIAALSTCGLARAASEDDRLLASQCLGCHAVDSTGKGGFDRLGGESAREIVDELLEMQFENEGSLMHAQARGYSEDQIRRIADWFASRAAASNVSTSATRTVVSKQKKGKRHDD